MDLPLSISTSMGRVPISFHPWKNLLLCLYLEPIIMVWVSIPLMMNVAEQLLKYLLLIDTAFEDYVCIQVLHLLSNWTVLSFLNCVSSSHSLPRHSLWNRWSEILIPFWELSFYVHDGLHFKIKMSSATQTFLSWKGPAYTLFFGCLGNNSKPTSWRFIPVFIPEIL